SVMPVVTFRESFQKKLVQLFFRGLRVSHAQAGLLKLLPQLSQLEGLQKPLLGSHAAEDLQISLPVWPGFGIDHVGKRKQGTGAPAPENFLPAGVVEKGSTSLYHGGTRWLPASNSGGAVGILGSGRRVARPGGSDGTSTRTEHCAINLP